MPALVKPRAAHMLALLWRAAHPGGAHSVFLARPGALSVMLEQRRSWGECVAAGYRPCGRVAVRLDLVEKLAEAIESEAPPDDAALARLIGRPVRDLPGVLNALRYRHGPALHGEPKRWRRAGPRPKQPSGPTPADNAFSALANLLPASTLQPRRRRGRPA
jgi:ATP-dependent RNA helicase SUPV3L1/SUV3